MPEARKTCVAIRHVGFEDLGAFAPAFAAAGFDIAYGDVGACNLAALDPDLLVVLGGPIGAYEDEAYPFLTDEIALTEAGAASCLAPFVHDPVTLHWHGDTFDLPAGAARLATTELCENQAFAMGRNVIAFQFHPEAGAGAFEPWLVGHAVELARAGIDVSRLRADAEAYGARLARKAERVAAAWLAQIQD